MKLTTDFNASIALCAFFRLMETTPSLYTTAETVELNITYKGTGTGLEFYEVEHIYKQLYNFQNTLYINKKTYDVQNQEELASLLCYEYLGKQIKELLRGAQI